MIRSAKLRNSARGQICTFQIPGVCNGDTATTVLAHLPDESHGMGLKADDLSAAFACSSCHDVLDWRSRPNIGEDWGQVRDWYMRRAQVRTWRAWVAMGLVKVQGHEPDAIAAQGYQF